MKGGTRNAAGITLLEMVVVIFVLSIISLLMLQIMVANSRHNGMLLSRIERSRSLNAAAESLFRDVESAVPYVREGKVLFSLRNGKEGDVDSDRVTFVLPARQTDGSIRVVERAYFLQRELHGAKTVWLLAWADDDTLDGKVASNRGHVVTVLDGMQSVSFDVSAAAPGDGTWQEEWATADGLPEKLRVELQVTDPRDPDHPLRVVETIYVMAG